MDGLFNFVNDDIGITILSLLPQKSLLKFRSVSKSWRHTIDDSTFRELHVENQLYSNTRRNDDDKDSLSDSDYTWKLSKRPVDSLKSCTNQVGFGILGFSESDHAFICLEKNYAGNTIALCDPSIGNQLRNKSYDDDKAFLQLIPGDSWKLSMRLPDSKNSWDDFPSYQDFFRGNGLLGFSGPVHGLICLYRIHSDSSISIALCNPSLGKIKTLPSTTVSVSVSYCFRDLGFGYDDVNKDYKVVQIWFNNSKWHNIVEVFSRKQNTWKVLSDHPVHRDLMITDPIRRLQPWMRADVVYWYGFQWSTRADFQNYELDSVIISFDMHTEALEVITMPFIKRSSNVCAVAREDSILLFATLTLAAFESKGVNIWEYKRDWNIICSCIRPFLTSFMSNGLVFKIFDDNKLVLYDYWTKKEIKCFYLNDRLMEKKEEDERKIQYMGSFISP